jgi:hypothetical protein
MRRIALAAFGLVLTMAPGLAGGHFHPPWSTTIDRSKIQTTLRFPTCREGFTPSTSKLIAGQAYLCNGPHLTCSSDYRLTQVSAGSGTGDRISSYTCRAGQLDPNDYSGFNCGSRWELWDDPQAGATGRVDFYICHRKLEDDRTTRCANGWSPTPEDFPHGLPPSTYNPNFDYQPTAAFYNCAPN